MLRYGFLRFTGWVAELPVRATTGKHKFVLTAMPNKISYDDLLSEAKKIYLNL
jgi:hypothetical protein